MTEQSYNGWANYPTWCVALWLDNDEALYNETRYRVRDAFELDHGASAVAQALKEWVCDELTPDLGASFLADLLSYALGEVDWHEIASNLLAEVARS